MTIVLLGTPLSPALKERIKTSGVGRKRKPKSIVPEGLPEYADTVGRQRLLWMQAARARRHRGTPTLTEWLAELATVPADEWDAAQVRAAKK
jgi:hypothetical protein